jgi:transcriptional regulator with XRE-family HTH domain
MRVVPEEQAAAEVAGEVRAWLARRKRSARSVALELGWTEPYLSRRLTGGVPFNVIDLAAIAGVLEIPMSVFFDIPSGGIRTAPFSDVARLLRTLGHEDLAWKIDRAWTLAGPEPATRG